MYALTVLAPGDPALAAFRGRYGDQASPDPESLAAIRRQLDLDLPLYAQYGRWLLGIMQGDFGTSITRRTPVLPLLVDRLPPTLAITFGALAVAFVLAIVVGVLASLRRGIANLMLGITQLGISIPDYFVALVLMLVFAVQLQILPVSGWGQASGLVLPIVTLMLRPWATLTRLVMTGVEEAIHSDWVRTGRAKGLRDNYLLYRHVLPHALLPVISVLGIAASGALATALVVEVVFAIPGAGRLLYEAVLQRDIPLVQAALLVQVALAITANAAANAAMRLVNPTLR